MTDEEVKNCQYCNKLLIKRKGMIDKTSSEKGCVLYRNIERWIVCELCYDELSPLWRAGG